MVKEEYFKKLETRLLKYWDLSEDFTSGVIGLAREIAKYTDDEKKVTRIVNRLRYSKVHSIEGLIAADIDELAKLRNIGLDAENILRQIKGLPTKTYADKHPFSKKKTKDKILEYLSQYDDNDLVKVKYLRQLLEEDKE